MITNLLHKEIEMMSTERPPEKVVKKWMRENIEDYISHGAETNTQRLTEDALTHFDLHFTTDEDVFWNYAFEVYVEHLQGE